MHGFAFGQGYQAELMRRSAERDFAYEAAYAAEVCEASFRASIDWSAFSADIWGSELNAGRACDRVLNALQSVCSDADGREGVQGALSEVKCAPGGQGLSYGGGSIQFAPSITGDSHSSMVNYLRSAFGL